MAHDSAPVQLHLHRGIGFGIYGTATVAVFVLVVLGTVDDAADGRYLMAAVIALAGLALTAFLAVVTHAMVWPALTVDTAGVRGRMPRGRRVDAAWDAVGLDVDDTAPGRIRLDVGGESVEVTSRSWVGFRDFVVLLGTTPQAAARLSPAARREVFRLLTGHRVAPEEEPEIS